MIRKEPLEVTEVELPSGASVTVPTLEETLRIKAFLVVRRVASQLVRQLSDPRPADRSVTEQLGSYRRLRKRWSDWSAVTEVLGEVAARMLGQR